MEQVYYKVLSEGRKSIVQNTSLKLTYPVGVWTEPIIKGSKLMVFEKKEDAVALLLRHQEEYWEIAPCHIRLAEFQPTCILTSFGIGGNLQKFWDGASAKEWEQTLQLMKIQGANWPLPKGTVFADAVYCLE